MTAVAARAPGYTSATIAATRLAERDVELEARRQEAGAFIAALRTLVHQLEITILSAPEPPLDAMSATARIRGVADRYEARWGEL